MLAKILIVDDQPQELSGLLAWLQREDYETTLIKQADGLLKMIEQTTPDLLVLDSVMPGVDGLEMCRRLRSTPLTKELPIILLVPQNNEAFITAEALQAGANDLIPFPVNTRVAHKRIKTLLEACGVGLGDSRHLLEETCQSANAVMECDLAWILVAEGKVLHSRIINSERGEAAAEVFLRIINNNSIEHPVYPILSASNPIAEAAINALEDPMINIRVEEVAIMPGGEPLARALRQLRLSYIHFVPLLVQGQVIGMLVTAGNNEYTMSNGRSARLLQALLRQCIAVLENLRLISSMAAREKQMETEQVFRRMVLDTMGEGLVVLDEKALIRYVNSRLLRLTGFERHELYGNSVGVLFHPDSRRGVMETLYTQHTNILSQQLLTRQGPTVPVMLSRATMPDNKQNYKLVMVITDITEQVKRAQALERQSDRLRTLNDAMRKITAALSQEDVIATVLEAAFDAVKCLNSCVYLFDSEEPDTIRVVAANGVHAETLQTVALRSGQGIAGRVIARRKTELVSYLAPDAFEPPVIEPEGSSVIAVPMMVLDTLVGVLEVIDKAEGRFVEEDCEILENLASAAAIAMENAHLFSQAERQVNELSMMLDASSAVSSTLDINGILELITRRLAEALNVSRCSISTWHKEANQLIVLADTCNAFWEPESGPHRAAVDIPILATVLQREQLLIARRSDDKLDPRLREYLGQLGMANAAFVPLVAHDEVVGLVELFNPQDEQLFKLGQVHAVRDAIAQWRLGLTDETDWYSYDRLTDLANMAQIASRANWCAISMWDRRNKQLTVLREIGFAVWDEQKGNTNRLDTYPTMANSLSQGMPITLLPALLFNDPEEAALMERSGARTGLVTPLVVHGEATGLVKLLDVTNDRSFDAAEVSLCQAIANVVASALENARLFYALQKRANALQAAYDEMRQQDKLKDNLIQNLSHELKTPLMQAMYELSLLADGEMGEINEEQKSSVQAVLNRVETLGNRVTDMVKLHASQALQFARVDLKSVLDRVVESARSKASRSGKKINYQSPHNCVVNADEARLAEVFDQLLDNAIKFSPNAEQIDISVENGGYLVKVNITDEGIGIPNEEFDKIFQPGYQVEGSASRRFGGTGLGLSIVKQIVEGHGGKVWVNSVVGQGSTFGFSIPTWQDETAYENGK
ncbi:MAG: GAF domain-containing protein [Anaerolineae bacterium]|nr:GAF domain-containing protein [Anaerolineae bacterium]